jgi:phospholipid-binding lipoprotein MlaA
MLYNKRILDNFIEELMRDIIKIIFVVIQPLLMLNVYGESQYDLPDDIDTSETIEVNDCFECTNRKIYNFNKSLDKVLILPTTKVYGAMTFSDWGRTRVNNALQNLYEPNRMINSIFYGKPAGFFTSALRFLLNSTLGLFGTFDPATKLGVKKYDISFREVAAEKLCMKNKSYIILPMLGPSTVRNATALSIDKFLLDPFTFIFPIYGSIARFGLEVISIRHDKKDIIDQITEDSIDEYAMVRGLYYQSSYSKEFDDCCKKGDSKTKK